MTVTKTDLTWSYGVTTIPSRRDHTLPGTLRSLASAGFDAPHLFVDGCENGESWSREFELPVTCRDVPVRTFGNWVLSLWELYLRNPSADRYAIFQDDVILSRNLREYLDSVPWVPQSYLNLYTAISNHVMVFEGTGFYRSNQMGKGALALVFDLKAVQSLLSSTHMVERPTTRTPSKPGSDWERGQKSLDGAVVTAMTKAGVHERVHRPSLVQHVGYFSSMENSSYITAPEFRGEEFDATEFLKEKGIEVNAIPFVFREAK